MTRKEFIKLCILLGISMPFQPMLAAGESTKINTPTKFKETVLIIGAGAAGLTAGYLLHQQGINFQILEASSTYGGRMKTNKDFVDFPVPLGAEWLHVKRGIFNEIVNDPSVQVTIQTKKYDANKDYGLYKGKEVTVKDLGLTIDQKFINSSWLGFFEQYVIPSIKNKITFNEIVESIDYSGEKAIVETNNREYTTDKIILTIPVKMLQSGSITFTPPLPADKLKALSKITVWDGFKAFIEFSENFYPTAVDFKTKPRKAGQKMYYDAAYSQKTTRHVLGLFTVGSGTLPYRNLPDNQLITYILKELDELFDGKATKSYIKHTTQNWNNEPFIQGAYINDYENWRRIRTLGQSVNNQLFFAGSAYTNGNDWGSVHTASRSAIRAVNEIVQ